MKLYFEPPGLIWSPERYHYAAEQMMLTLFPGQRPEYPEDMPHTLEEPAAVFTLEREGEQARITAQVVWEGGRRRESEALSAEELDGPPERVYHVIQHALKLAFYRAGTALLGVQPPWGALTGVRPVKLPTWAMLAGVSPR